VVYAADEAVILRDGVIPESTRVFAKTHGTQSSNINTKIEIVESLEALLNTYIAVIQKP
jgi:hypothetical protein